MQKSSPSLVNNPHYQQCTRCVMDTSAIEISFDINGVCTYCLEAENELPNYQFTKTQEKNNLEELTKKIINTNKNKYDSILGLSGGVDSSYVAYLAWKMKLNPLCVHFDNGWNSEISVQNIHKIIENTGFDLETYVIDWPEFKDLQKSFLKAGVIDIEMLTDHAIFASLFKIRKQNKIKYVLSGTNYATEHGIPFSWIWPKMDKKNILSIHNKFGDKKIKSFPTMSYLRWELMKRFRLGGEFIEILNLINFNKTKAMNTLKSVFDWNYYGGKHYESRFTKFYQAHILPNKFNVDKRKPHLSALIRNNEINKKVALAELKKPLYKEQELKEDLSYVIKKLDFLKEEFNMIMDSDPVSHYNYPNSRSFYKKIKDIF